MHRDPLVQAEAQARWLSDSLSESQFKAFVQPVVVLAGKFIKPFDMKVEGVRVLEPNSLNHFLDRLPERFLKDEVKAVAAALLSYVRSKAGLSNAKEEP